FFLMEEDGTIIDYYASDKANLYASPQEFIGKTMVEVLPDVVAQQFKESIEKVILEKGVTSFEYELPMAQGLTFFEARVSHLPKHKQVVTIVRDITEQHKSTEVIKHHAYYDTLTQLPNRFLVLDRLSQLLNEAQRNKEKTAVLFLDLDDFKMINDTFGHEIGDNLLIEVANRLNKIVRKEDTVGRLGGDEFIILLRGLNEDHNALTIAEHLLKSFKESFKIDGRELMITLSIGIAIYPDNGKSACDLLRNADTAMYKAKGLGRNTYSFFTKAMNVSMLRRLDIEEQMHGALERQEFEVVYQAQFDIQNKQIIGAEALLRWHNSVLGNICPKEFIPVAEHTGLIVSIGQFVLKQALCFIKEWQKSVHGYCKVSVNLSPRQFRDTELVTFIKKSLADSQIPANNLELEITEEVLMVGQPDTEDALKSFNKFGIKLSMDDFGTGYSSLSYLRQYDFDVLKIDSSFIKGITLVQDDYDLVKATIAMAHSLGMKVIAEGVETKAQVDLLADLHCDYFQGYYLSEPISSEQFFTLYHKIQH
ncbi:MAG: EAL domain-containing protein, partial [Colwellia sp.]|nr:EAL domain-containing protein [Colwellia sp.]